MNKLTVVVDKLIYKRYETAENCSREYKAWEKFNELIPENTPALVVKKPALCVYEYLSHEPGYITKKEASFFAARVIANIYANYSPTSYKKGEMWRMSVVNLIKDFKELKNVLEKLNLGKFYQTTLKSLKKIERSEFTNISFLHRDIHKGNIINENGHLYLIDHEHAMEGPIELELQNSLFWNDRMSLNTILVKKYLRTMGISYSNNQEQLLKYYYVADQLVMAARDNKLAKLIKIAKKAFCL